MSGCITLDTSKGEFKVADGKSIINIRIASEIYKERPRGLGMLSWSV